MRASIGGNNIAETPLVWLTALAHSSARAVAIGADGSCPARANHSDALFLDQAHAAAGRLNADVAADGRVEVMNKLTDVPKIAHSYAAKKVKIDALIVHATPLEKINDAFGLTANVQSIRKVIIHDAYHSKRATLFRRHDPILILIHQARSVRKCAFPSISRHRRGAQRYRFSITSPVLPAPRRPS